MSTCSARISPGRRKSTEPPRFRRPRPVAAARPRRRRPSVSGKNPKPRADQQILARPVDPGSGGHGEKPGGLRRACSPCLQGTLVDLSRGVAYRSEMALLPWRAFLWDFGVRDVGPRTHVWWPGAPRAARCPRPRPAAGGGGDPPAQTRAQRSGGALDSQLQDPGTILFGASFSF